jgi:hypothetical protein
MRTAACILVICFAAATPVWALPPCPAARDIPLTGTVVGWGYGGTPQPHSLQMHPCEEFWLDVQASSSDPWIHANIYVDAFNTFGTKIDTRNWPISYLGSTSISVPNALPTASLGFPQPGTRDPRSIVTRIEIWSDYARAGALAVSYTLTAHFRPRPGYNVGGLSYADAYGPLAHGTVLKASMWPLEVNYYRVSLLPGGALTLSGSLTNENWGLGAHLQIGVRNMAQQSQGTILSQVVPNNSSHDPNGVTVPFTSSTFTNTSAQTQDFYLVMENANSARLQDVTINVTGNLVPPPQLTLFLDADGNFSTTTPSSDHTSYLPGADLATAISVPLPQTLQLIAAYVDASGQIVPPPSWATEIDFELSATTAFPGIAMNSGTQTGQDFALGAHLASFSVDHTARVALSCNDYGGFTISSASDRSTTKTMRVPYDSNNWIPDIGWRVYKLLWDEGSQDFVYVLLEVVPDLFDADDDTDGSSEVLGDNLSAFEEFRGFMVRGVHYRTSPSMVDIFLHSYVIGPALDDARSIVGLRWHTPFPSEINSTRRINFNATGIPGHVDQQAVLMFNVLLPSGDDAGSVPCDPLAVPFVCYPNIIGNTKGPNYADWDALYNVKIHENTIRAAAPDNVEEETIRSVIGHELGHSIGIGHNADQTSIMKAGIDFLTGLTPTHVFLVPSDTSQVRLK